MGDILSEAQIQLEDVYEAFVCEGQARRPYIPYDRIEYSGTIRRQPLLALERQYVSGMSS